MKRGMLVVLLAALMPALAGSLMPAAAGAAEFAPIKEKWSYAPAQRTIAKRFKGTPGVVLHVGDAITYANPYGQWARMGQGQTESDKNALEWMHCGKDDDSDGWWLARVDREGNRSDTAATSLRTAELLQGKDGLPALADLLTKYKPQVLVLLIGTNDVTDGRAAREYKSDMEKIIRLVLSNGTVLILSTLPPHPKNDPLARSCNAALMDLGRKYYLPMIDYYDEIIRLSPKDWNGTIMEKDGLLPTHGELSAAEPTVENFRKSGYLLRGWLSVQKIKQVRDEVLKPAGKDR